MDMNLVYNNGFNITGEDVCDAYTFLGYKYNLSHYRILTTKSLILPKKLERNKDIPDYGYDFIAENGKVLAIFNIINGKSDYAILRSLKEKKFLTMGTNRAIPYGIGTWRDFVYGKMVVVVEGLKDRDIVSTFYPYVIAAQTAGLNMMSKRIMLTITNKFLLLYDNDEAGIKATKRDYSWFLGNSCTVYKGKHPEGVKDCGEVADKLYSGDYFKSDYLKLYYQKQIESYL